MEPNRLREAIEARHPDAAGWDVADRGLDPADARLLEEALRADPELAAELARVEAWDVELAQSFDDVPVPAGLAERLLAAAQAPEVAAVAPAVNVPTSTVEAPAVVPSRGLSRRTWIGSLIAVAAALLAMVGVANWVLMPEQLALEPLLEEAQVVALAEVTDGDWSTNWKAAAVAEHAFDTSALLAAPLRWRQQATKVDREAVIYDLAGPRRKGAHLLVYRAPNKQSDLSSFPARAPQSTTGGYSLGAWQRGDLVFVLVVEGSAARYGTFVKELTTG